MGAQNNHPRQAQKRPVHRDVDGSADEALLDVAWAFLGPGALRQGLPAPDGAFLREAVPSGRGSTPLPRPVQDPPTPSGGGSHDPRPGETSTARPSRLRLRLAMPRVDLTTPLPHSGSVPLPAPPSLRIRQDGVRVVARPPAMLPGVDPGEALRMDLHPVSDGIVYVARPLVLRELGDDDKGAVVTGVVPVGQLTRFWSTTAQGLPPSRPVIVRLRSDHEAELLGLLRALAPPTLRVVSYRLDESPVGSQRSSYLLPEVDADVVASLGVVREDLESVRSAHLAHEDTVRTGRLHLNRRRADRFIRRTTPGVMHSLSPGDPADATDVYVDGSVLRGTRTGGAAAVVPEGRWAAVALPGATLPLEAELEALALGHFVAVWTAEPGRRVVIHSDSRAALALLREAHRERLTLGDARGERIRRALRRLLSAADLAVASGVDVMTMWVKGHAGTRGNELADDLARSAARNTAAGVSAEELRHRLEHVADLWTPAPGEQWAC